MFFWIVLAMSQKITNWTFWSHFTSDALRNLGKIYFYTAYGFLKAIIPHMYLLGCRGLLEKKTWKFAKSHLFGLWGLRIWQLKIHRMCTWGYMTLGIWGFPEVRKTATVIKNLTLEVRLFLKLQICPLASKMCISWVLDLKNTVIKTNLMYSWGSLRQFF